MLVKIGEFNARHGIRNNVVELLARDADEADNKMLQNEVYCLRIGFGDGGLGERLSTELLEAEKDLRVNQSWRLVRFHRHDLVSILRRLFQSVSQVQNENELR